MTVSTELPPNTYYIEVSEAGLPEVDGLYVPSTAPVTESESGTVSTLGYWNNRFAWDRADGKSARSPALSYSNSYKSWRICRLDGHLAYDNTCQDTLPPTTSNWHVYKKGVAPAPKVVLHHCDPREPCPRPNVVFVIGGPGSGKGTMCELAQEQLGWAHLSTGDLLRVELSNNGPAAATIEKFITNGELVPNEIMVTLLKNAMDHHIRSTGNLNFLLDGFPRSLDNMKAWYDIFGRDTELPTMLYFECPYDVLEKRIMGRAKYSGRSDDNIESMKLRFDTYKKETLPTVELFRKNDKCLEIDSSHDRETVYQRVIECLSAYTDKALVEQPLSHKAEVLLGIRSHSDTLKR